jgi:hypothetical protein
VENSKPLLKQLQRTTTSRYYPLLLYIFLSSLRVPISFSVIMCAPSVHFSTLVVVVVVVLVVLVVVLVVGRASSPLFAVLYHLVVAAFVRAPPP